MRDLLILMPIALAALAAGATAQNEAGFVQVEDRTWAWIPGRDDRATGALFAGSREALAVDPGLSATEVRAFMDAAARLTQTPVRHVVATGAAPSRVLGAALMPQRAFSFITREKTRFLLATHDVLRDTPGRRGVADLARGLTLPDRPVDDDVRIDLGDRVIELIALREIGDGRAIAVWDAAGRVLATGDFFIGAEFPDLRRRHVERWFDDLDRLTGLGPSHVVPGRGGITTGDALLRHVDYLRGISDAAQTGSRAGLTADAVLERLDLDTSGMRDGPDPAMTLRGNVESVLAHMGTHDPVLPSDLARKFRGLSRDDLVADGEATAMTSDGRLGFTPRITGTVTVHDHFNDVEIGEVPAGRILGRGCVLPDDTDFVVPVRGSGAHLAVINTASFRVEDRIEVGFDPWVTALSDDGSELYVLESRLPWIWVLSTAPLAVLGRIEFDPDGRLLVPGGDPIAARDDSTTAMTEVCVLGMTHGRHLTSERWGLTEVRAAIRRYEPDVVLTEIPPNRWRRIEEDWFARGVLEDERIKLFPEYVDVLLPLAVREDFEIVPCAAWTAEMARQRRRRAAELERPEHAELAARMSAARTRAAEAGVDALLDADDPHVIHSRAYDDAVRLRMAASVLANDHIGPGGWTDINAAHYALIAKALDRHRGRRVLVLFGAWHKYWFLEQLAGRDDVELVDARALLEPVNEDDMERDCVEEVTDLHRFFQEWFRGELEQDDAAFARVERALAPEFRMVDPRATVVSRRDCLARIRAAHATRGPTSRITIENASASPLADGLWLVRYEEWIKNDDKRTGIRSTAVFRADPAAPRGVAWVNLHETFIPTDD